MTSWICSICGEEITGLVSAGEPQRQAEIKLHEMRARDNLLSSIVECLCVAEGHSGKQTAGYWTVTSGSGEHIFVPIGERPCRICRGTGLCPAWRRDNGLPMLEEAR
jgi:hypothetical protein